MLRELVEAALGLRTPDLVISGGTVVDVLTGELWEADLAVYRGRIVSVGRGARGREEVSADGLYLIPGLMDAHMHVESTLVTPGALAEALAPRGVTSVFADPHEVANVLGVRGIELLLSVAGEAPLRLFLQVPSRVPTAPGLEDSGAEVTTEDVAALLGEAASLGEMNYQHVLSLSPEHLARVEIALSMGRVVDGHMAGLSGPGVDACVAAGLSDDHECVSGEEALERVRRGCAVMVREGSTERNLRDVLPALAGLPDARMVMFCTDDRHPDDLLSEGSVDAMVRTAIELGVDPVRAVQMATINTARHFGVDRLVGCLAPGRAADVVAVGDLRRMDVEFVLFDGRPVFWRGETLFEYERPSVPGWALDTVRVADLSPGDLLLEAPGWASEAVVRVIEVIAGQIVNREGRASLPVEGGFVRAEGDLLHIAVVERHRGARSVGRAFVRGFGPLEGAVASSVAHDHHNVVVAGSDPGDMLTAVRRLAQIGGGFVAVSGGSVLGELRLPLAGLLSLDPVEEVASSLRRLRDAVRGMGCALEKTFMQLSFVTLPTVPELGLTNRGLVDARRFEIVDPVVEFR